MNQFKGFSLHPLNEEAVKKAGEIWDSRTRPIGSLGTLKEMTIQLAKVTGNPTNDLDKKVVIVMASDNGIYEEDVSSSSQAFTYMLTNAMTRGEAGVAALCSYQESDIAVTNIGIINQGPYEGNIIQKQVSQGTKNFIKEPAIPMGDIYRAIQAGMDVAEDYTQRGYKILGTGELGTANATTSSAVLVALSQYKVEDCVGLGGGITNQQLVNRVNVIKKAIEKCDLYNQDVFVVLSCIGGLDICDLIGAFLARAKYGVPVVIDGIASAAATLCADRIAPGAKEFFSASHLSMERAMIGSLDLLGKEALVYLHIWSGKRSGYPFTFTIFDHALYAMKNMGTSNSNTVQSTLFVNTRNMDGDQK